MTSQRKAGALLGYTNILVKNLVYLVYTPMLLHFVGQADYGVYQSSNSFVFSLTLLTFGFSEAYVRFYMRFRSKHDENGIKKLNGTYLLLYAIICLIALVLGLTFSANAGVIFLKGFTSEEVSLAHVLLAIMTVNISLTLFSTVFDAFIIAHERFVFQQSRQMFTTLAAPLLSFLLLELGMGAIGVAFAQLAVTIVLLILNMRFAIGRLEMRFQFRGFDISLLKAIAVFSAWIFANQICELANQNLPNILLGALSGAQAVAIFAVAVQVRSLFYSLSTTMSSVFTPLINRMVAETDDNNQLTKLMTRVGRYQAILYLWAWGGFLILGRFFIDKWAGHNFADAYWMVLAMTAPLFIPLVQNTGIEIQRAKNRHKARSIAYLCMAVVNVSLTIVLAPNIGYWAPVVGYVAYVVLGCGFFMNWYYQAHIGLSMFYFWKHQLPTIGFAIVIFVLCLIGENYLPVSSMSMFILWGIVYTLIYGVGVMKVSLTKQEREKIAKRLSWMIHHN